MANMLQSSQTQATNAPGYYTDYLSNLANKGQAAAGQAQFVGAQPLQTQAFCKVATNFGAQQPAFQTGQGYVGQAAGQDVTGAALPYLQSGTTASPLCAAKPLICQSANLNLGSVANEYMSPYIQSAIGNMSDIAQRNIRSNLSPSATAAAVGSGQFGSQRGAQVLGQLTSQANQDLNSQIANLLNQGYGQALGAAQTKQGALTNLANTTTTAQQAQNTANLTAAQTAANAAANEGQLLNQAGQTMGTLGTQAGTQNLACINALSTLGGQQQTIGQNEQNFPLTNLASLSNLLQGYSIPTSTSTTLCMSPFSAAAALGAGTLGMLTKCATTGTAPLSSAISTVKDLFKCNTSDLEKSLPPGMTLNDYWASRCGANSWTACCCELYNNVRPNKDGGWIKSKATGGSIGCASTQYRGGLPTTRG
jgi:hypothetical protein